MIVPQTVGEVMSPVPYFVGPSDALEDAKKLMYQHSIRHLPVLENGKILGMLSDRDLKLALAVKGSANIAALT
ncbi:MAG: CBS domain-containing protein, partial [Bdellovibrionales bacterium]|nr:CBS domain-containing protein [Bdellovibrionales bacterium]